MPDINLSPKVVRDASSSVRHVSTFPCGESDSVSPVAVRGERSVQMGSDALAHWQTDTTFLLDRKCVR